MKAPLFSLLLIACTASLANAQGLGDRSKTVTTALETTLKKKAADITADDLAGLTNLELPHIHIPAFHSNDFDGLTKLKTLRFRSLFHKRGKTNDPAAFSGMVFAKLSTLEELSIHTRATPKCERMTELRYFCSSMQTDFKGRW